MKTKKFTILEMQQYHRIECPIVSFEYFMAAYCHNILAEGEFQKVEVFVSPTFRFQFSNP